MKRELPPYVYRKPAGIRSAAVKLGRSWGNRTGNQFPPPATSSPRAEEGEPEHLDALFLTVWHLIAAHAALEGDTQ